MPHASILQPSLDHTHQPGNSGSMKTSKFQYEPRNHRAQAPQTAASAHGHQCLEKKDAFRGRKPPPFFNRNRGGSFPAFCKKEAGSRKQSPKKLTDWSIPVPCLAQRRYVHHLAIVNQETNRNEPKSSAYISLVAENPTNLSVLDVMHLDRCHVCFKLSFQWKRLLFHPNMRSTMQAYPFMTLKPLQCIGRKCCFSFVWTGWLYAFHSNTAEITNCYWSVLNDAWKDQNPCPSQSSQPSLK